jgi:CheY-like chemotaxis protein
MMTLLVAEDSSGDAFLLQQALSKAGIRVSAHFVKDGQEALDYLQGLNLFADRSTYPLPTLLLTDLKMPRMDGFDVLAWLRQQPGLRRLPAVVFSSSALPEDVSRAYDLGANSYLVKPMDFKDWKTVVKALESYWLEINVCPECAAA